jgi:hypothetical protein
MPRVIRSLVCVVVFALCAFAIGGCTTHYIPNTDLEDSDENRSLVEFCEVYRKAVEHKDVTALLSMASPKYYEDGGNVDASDDIDYAGLRDYLVGKFQEASGIRYEIRYRRVVKEEDKIFVDYTFTASYRLPGDKGADVWRRKVDDNRLELVPYKAEGSSKYREAFQIVAGM